MNNILVDLALESTPFLPLSDLHNNVLKDTPQKANSCNGSQQFLAAGRICLRVNKKEK